MSRESRGRPMPGALLVAISCLLFCGVLAIPTRAQEQPPHPPGNYPASVDPWEIIIYEQPNFSGTWCSYRMQPGTRQRLVTEIYPGMETKVGSIQIGSKVKVVTFAGNYFYAGSESDWTFFTQSISKVEIGYQVHSLIVFPKDARWPIGIWLADERFSCGRCEETFFPLPESETINEASWGFLGNFNLDQNANDIFVGDPKGKESIEVVLYDQRDFGGQKKTLPGDLGNWGNGSWSMINLGQFNWSDRAASLIVSWKGPKLALGPSVPQKFEVQAGIDRPGADYRIVNVKDANLCEQACAGDQKCKSFAWVKPNGNCFLKTSVPKPVSNSAIVSGVNAKDWAALSPEYQKPLVAAVFVTQAAVDRPGGNYKDFDIAGGYSDCQKACAEDPKCKAYTWVKPGVQATSAVCWLKSSVPNKPVYNANCVSGITADLLATLPPEYKQPQLQQSSTSLITNSNPATEGQVVTLTAKVTSSSSTPTGMVTFKEGSAMLATIPLDAGGQASFSTAGLTAGTHSITATYNGNLPLAGSTSPTLIQTVNQSAASTAVDIAGLWHSSVGVDYIITQTGGQFTWVLGLINETGKGTLTGQDLSVNWSGPMSNGSATGKITKVDATGKATRIDWSNGAFFYR